MDTYATVRDAFYSGQFDFTGDAQTIRDIAFLIDQKDLELRIFPIATKAAYQKELSNLENPTRAHDAAGGSNEHIALKLLTAKYLKNERGRGSRYEYPLCGYYPDVVTIDGLIVAECGHTHNAEKMLAYFRQSAIEECILIPYPDPDGEEVLGYSFTASEGLCDFLAFWESEKHAKLRKKFKR